MQMMVICIFSHRDYTVNIFMYRKDLFEKAGIKETPTTWKEFEEDCQKLADIGRNSGYYRWFRCMADYEISFILSMESNRSGIYRLDIRLEQILSADNEVCKICM